MPVTQEFLIALETAKLAAAMQVVSIAAIAWLGVNIGAMLLSDAIRKYLRANRNI